MTLVLLLVFITALYAWLQSVLAVAGFHRRLSLAMVLLGLMLALAAIIWPLIMWSATGRIYVFGPPFVYLLFSVIAPYGFGMLLIGSPASASSTFGSMVGYAALLAVSLLFPFLCGYFFLAPEKMGVAALLGIAPHH